MSKYETFYYYVTESGTCEYCVRNTGLDKVIELYSLVIWRKLSPVLHVKRSLGKEHNNEITNDAAIPSSDG